MLRLTECQGLSVAIVGRAGYLRDSGSGPEIDSAEVVVRINWMLPIAPELVPGCGQRTDILYTSTARDTLPFQEAAEALGVPVVRSNAESRHKVSQIVTSNWSIYTPTTGTVALWDALECGARKVALYGFDLYTTAAYYDGTEHRAHEVFAHEREIGKQTHDMEIECQIMRKLTEDPRVRIDPALRGVLQC